ncbi:hypothetical protein ACHAXS_006893 [Conticribra weissflogii]
MEEYSSYEKAVALIPKFPAFLSMFSSIFIVQHVLRDQKRRTHIYHRILCCMSISDIIGSIGLFLSTWPIPKGEAYLAAGNVRTCIAAGFFNQSATLCTPAYNVSLAIYYLLVVVKGWKENNIAKAEKYLHAFPIILGVGTGIAGIPLRLYNGAGLHLCWIQSGLPNHPENHNPHFSEFRVGFMRKKWINIQGRVFDIDRRVDKSGIKRFFMLVLYIFVGFLDRRRKFLNDFPNSNFSSCFLGFFSTFAERMKAWDNYSNILPGRNKNDIVDKEDLLLGSQSDTFLDKEELQGSSSHYVVETGFSYGAINELASIVEF